MEIWKMINDPNTFPHRKGQVRQAFWAHQHGAKIIGPFREYIPSPDVYNYDRIVRKTKMKTHAYVDALSPISKDGAAEKKLHKQREIIYRKECAGIMSEIDLSQLEATTIKQMTRIKLLDQPSQDYDSPWVLGDDVKLPGYSGEYSLQDLHEPEATGICCFREGDGDKRKFWKKDVIPVKREALTEADEQDYRGRTLTRADFELTGRGYHEMFEYRDVFKRQYRISRRRQREEKAREEARQHREASASVEPALKARSERQSMKVANKIIEQVLSGDIMKLVDLEYAYPSKKMFNWTKIEQAVEVSHECTFFANVKKTRGHPCLSLGITALMSWYNKYEIKLTYQKSSSDDKGKILCTLTKIENGKEAVKAENDTLVGISVDETGSKLRFQLHLENSHNRWVKKVQFDRQNTPFKLCKFIEEYQGCLDMQAVGVDDMTMFFTNLRNVVYSDAGRVYVRGIKPKSGSIDEENGMAPDEEKTSADAVITVIAEHALDEQPGVPEQKDVPSNV